MAGELTWQVLLYGRRMQRNHMSAEQMNWQTIWSIYFTADKWQYLRLCGNWSDINQQTVKNESFTMVLNCVFVLAPARKWSSLLQAVWETEPGRDSIRAAMQIVLWAFKGNGSQSGDCVQICWLLFWRGQAFFFLILYLHWRSAAVISVSHP